MAHVPARASRTADLLFDTFYSAAVGGSVAALFFLMVDSLAGQPLFTPSLLGMALFTNVPAQAVTEVRLDMVAYFSVVHFAAFAALGLGSSLLFRNLPAWVCTPVNVAVMLFVILDAAFLAPAGLLMPGVVDVVGMKMILAANVITAGSMTTFLRHAHRADPGEPAQREAAALG